MTTAGWPQQRIVNYWPLLRARHKTIITHDTHIHTLQEIIFIPISSLSFLHNKGNATIHWSWESITYTLPLGNSRSGVNFLVMQLNSKIFYSKLLNPVFDTVIFSYIFSILEMGVFSSDCPETMKDHLEIGRSFTELINSSGYIEKKRFSMSVCYGRRHFASTRDQVTLVTLEWFMRVIHACHIHVWPCLREVRACTISNVLQTANFTSYFYFQWQKMINDLCISIILNPKILSI